jgi:hypothetical protein
VDNNYLDLGMNKSGFVHTLPSGRLMCREGFILVKLILSLSSLIHFHIIKSAYYMVAYSMSM